MAAEAYAAPVPPVTTGSVRTWTLRRPATAPGPTLAARAQITPALPYHVPPTPEEVAYPIAVADSALMHRCANNAQGQWAFVAKLYVHNLDAGIGNQAVTQTYAAAPAAAGLGQVLGSSWKQSSAWFVKCGQDVNDATSRYLLTSAQALMKLVPAHDGTYTRVAPLAATQRVYADMAIIEFYDGNGGVHYAWVDRVSVMDNYAANPMGALSSNGAALHLGAAGLAAGGYTDPPAGFRLMAPLPAALPLPAAPNVNAYRAPIAFVGWPTRIDDFIATAGLHIARRPPVPTVPPVPLNPLLLSQYGDVTVQKNPSAAGIPFAGMVQWSNNPNAGPGGNPPPGIQSRDLEGGAGVISVVTAPGPPVAQRLAIAIWIQDAGLLGTGSGFQNPALGAAPVTGIDVKALLERVGIPPGNLTWTAATVTVGAAGTNNAWQILS